MRQGDMNSAHKVYEISLSETAVAVLYAGRVEVYSVDADGLEMFSHYAHGAELGHILGLIVAGGGL